MVNWDFAVAIDGCRFFLEIEGQESVFEPPLASLSATFGSTSQRTSSDVPVKESASDDARPCQTTFFFADEIIRNFLLESQKGDHFNHFVVPFVDSKLTWDEPFHPGLDRSVDEGFGLRGTRKIYLHDRILSSEGGH